MISSNHIDIVTGSAFIVAGLFALGRQSLLEPTAGKYPKAPSWLRHCMLGFSALQIFLGLQALTKYYIVTDPMALMACGLAIYNGAMLFNLLRQRYPEDVWVRLNRINDRLFCSQSAARRFISK